MSIIPSSTPTPASPSDTVSHTLALRLRARQAANNTARKTGLHVDSASIERAVVNVYRATGSRAEGVRTLHTIIDALRAQAAGDGGDGAA